MKPKVWLTKDKAGLYELWEKKPIYLDGTWASRGDRYIRYRLVRICDKNYIKRFNVIKKHLRKGGIIEGTMEFKFKETK